MQQVLRWGRRGLGAAALVLAVAYLARVVDGDVLREALAAVLDRPVGLLAALTAYAAAFALRSWAWCRVLPGLPLGQSWAALHVSLGGNHVLPLRLGEVLRVVSPLRRTGLPARPVVESAVVLRLGDLAAVGALALAAAPALLLGLAGPVAVVGVLALLAALGAGWLVVVRRARREPALRAPGPAVAVAVVLAWVLEAAVVHQVAAAAGLPLDLADAVAVTAVTIAAQAVAVTPGGVGTYEAAATAALVALGADPALALAVALATHAVKTAYALATGAVALVVPDPTWWGRARLARDVPPRPAPLAVDPGAPVVAFMPAHDEEAVVADVVRRVPATAHGREVVVVVVDDGSTDATAERAAAAGARVVRQPGNLGLGAAVRRGLAEAVALRPAAVVYLDSDGEYPPEELPAVVAPVLDGSADYVVGSRFAGEIRRMLPHRRVGNLVLTALLRWVARRPGITDGQSGMRAFSPAAAAAAEVVHDYNYAQVLTLDLLAKGFAYREVGISYAFRETGTSFVRLGRYLRRVVPAVWRELQTGPALPIPALTGPALTGPGRPGSVLDDVQAEPLARP